MAIQSSPSEIIWHFSSVSDILHPNVMWDTLKLSEIVKRVILRVEEVTWKWFREENKDLIIKASILDAIFNSLLKDRVIDKAFHHTEWEKNSLYYYTPSIWVFYRWIPVFLNQNYVEALWAEDLETLKRDLENSNLAFEKYYTPESAEEAKRRKTELAEWKVYSEIVLETKTWNKISWNGFWSGWNWLEIRLWNDVTYWKNQNTDTNDKRLETYTWNELSTQLLIQSFTNRVRDIITDAELRNLTIFYHLSAILDRVWNNWQHIMNITDFNEDDKQVIRLLNSRYSRALKRDGSEVIEKSHDGSLWKESYDADTKTLIDWLTKILLKEWHYIHDFPMIDSSWVKKMYSWARLLIQDPDFWIKSSFWIWNHTVSKWDAELNAFLETYR